MDWSREFIPYEEALALKELGFDEPCFAFYLAGAIRYKEYKDSQNKNSAFYNNTVASIPLYQQAFRWFREKYGCCGYTNIHKKEDKYVLNSFSEYGVILGVYDSWEIVELECLKEIIKIVKDGNQTSKD
jgi:hypothetical protein